jgi:hypothetical protein
MIALLIAFICTYSLINVRAESSTGNGDLPLFHSLSEFHLDEENRLYNHYLLIANNRKCEEQYSPQRFLFVQLLFLRGIILFSTNSIGLGI